MPLKELSHKEDAYDSLDSQHSGSTAQKSDHLPEAARKKRKHPKGKLILFTGLVSSRLI
jgi:hypothetical protein